MLRPGVGVIALVCVAGIGLAPASAAAETVCGTVDEFNAAMAAGGTTSNDVTLTFDVVGVNPADFPATKGSLAQFRNTACATGADAGIKVYGPYDPPNDSHPTGTLKLEYGNSCCAGDCTEHWADPNASAVIFVDGTEQCNVRMWMSPTEVGYSLMCNVGTFDALGENPEGNVVDQIALLEFLLPDGGTTWELPNATASNDEVCWESTPSDTMSLTVPVAEDVTAGPTWADAVFPDVGDLAVEAADNEAYLKFEVPPIAGRVTRVRLFMHTRTESSSEGDGGEVHLVTSNDWSEATLTWNTRPAQDPAALGRIGPAAADVQVSLDLGTAIEGGGTYSLAVVSPPSDGNGTHFFSKEGSAADAPYLIVDYDVVDGDGDGTPDGPDCNDADPAVGPTAAEVCNGIDDDCDGETDEDCDGASTGNSDDEGGESDGSGSAASGIGPGFPGGGRGEDLSACACTTPRGANAGWLLLVLALVRRRRALAR
jgi:hypothetical protein